MHFDKTHTLDKRPTTEIRLSETIDWEKDIFWWSLSNDTLSPSTLGVSVLLDTVIDPKASLETYHNILVPKSWINLVVQLKRFEN